MLLLAFVDFTVEFFIVGHVESRVVWFSDTFGELEGFLGGLV